MFKNEKRKTKCQKFIIWAGNFIFLCNSKWFIFLFFCISITDTFECHLFTQLLHKGEDISLNCVDIKCNYSWRCVRNIILGQEFIEHSWLAMIERAQRLVDMFQQQSQQRERCRSSSEQTRHIFKSSPVQPIGCAQILQGQILTKHEKCCLQGSSSETLCSAFY